MVAEVRVSDVKITKSDGHSEMGATINGEYVFYRVPSEFETHLRAEGFIAIALLEAMIGNVPIIVDDSITVSKKLFDQLSELQAIYSCWNSDLHIIEIKARISADESLFQSVGCCFSAGVDSSHTLLHKMDDITHLIMCWGFDDDNNEDSWKDKLEKQTAFAESLGKKLIPVVSNAREWIEKQGISWLLGHGLFLCTLGGLLGMKRLYIPSSHTYDELFPWGSHPLTDPMWSTESTEIVHYGAAYRRTEKIGGLLKCEAIANNLQICWRGIERNCGECSKCVRTMVAIELLEGQLETLPRLTDLKLLAILKPDREGLAAIVEDLIRLAKEKARPDIYNPLKRIYRWYLLQQVFSLVDRSLFNGAIRSVYRKYNRPDWVSSRVTLRGANRWDI